MFPRLTSTAKHRTTGKGGAAFAHSHAKWKVRFFVVMNEAGAERVVHGNDDSIFEALREDLAWLSNIIGVESPPYINYLKPVELKFEETRVRLIPGETVLDTSPYKARESF